MLDRSRWACDRPPDADRDAQPESGAPVSEADVLGRPAPPPDRTLSYGPDAEQVLDLRLPPTHSPAPLVVVVHGGFWKAAYDRSHAGPQSAALAAAGYVVGTVEYRRVGRPGRGSGGGWPGTFDDLARLCDTVVDLVGGAAPGRVDPNRVCFVGHSAGGHLVGWLASRHRLPAGCRWRTDTALPGAVVALAGVLDLDLADRLRLGDGAVRGLLGHRHRHPDRWDIADPARLVPTGVRTVLVHGTADRVVPVDLSRSYAAAAATAGDHVVLHELDGVEHFALIDPLAAPWPRVLAAVEEVLR